MRFFSIAKRLLTRKSQSDSYVVWNGVEEILYMEPTHHDCMVTYDSGLVPVQNLRKNLLKKGDIVPTIIFACQAGKPAYSVTLPDGTQKDVFNSHWNKIISANPKIIFRDAIIAANQRMMEELAPDGREQQAEIICQKDVLDKSVFLSSISRKKHFVMSFDMCRTAHPDPSDAKIVNDIDWL
jgi:hypothetical protein